MSSRRPRSRFAAPLVLTLALAPACVIRTRTSTPPPGGRDATQGQSDGTVTPIVNPPRPLPGDGTAETTPPPPAPTVGPIANPPPPDRVGPPTRTPPIKQTDPAIDVVQAGPNPQAAPTTWHVSQRADKTCYAVLDVQCPPAPATCNPPPALKLSSCPAGATTTTSLKVQETSPGECFVVYDAPACPATMACNPPRPAKTACPR